MSWFKRGDEALIALEQRERIAELLKKKSAPKFWLREGEEARVVFVDDTGFFCERHILKRGTSFQEVTCCSEIRVCPICTRENQRPVAITYFTVIDTREYIRRDGTVAKNTKVLLPAKRTLARQIYDYKKKYKSLVGAIATLKRFTSTDANCGIITEFERGKDGNLKRVKLTGDYALPLNYEEILAPPTEEEWAALGYSTPIIGGSVSLDDGLIDVDEDIIEENGDDDVPEEILKGIDETVSEEESEEESSEDIPF